jgi:hypothetical protein
MFGSLIPEKVAGKIVLCDRGTNVRLPLLQLRDAQTEGACTAAKVSRLRSLETADMYRSVRAARRG